MKPSQTVVLVVEDEVLVRVVAAETLENAGFQVLEAGNGKEALDLIDRGAHVDVLFTDVNMPGIDGITLAEMICGRIPAIRVVIASGRPLPRSNLPCDGAFLAKPYPLNDMTRMICDVSAA